jgi:hypothetical protein
VSSPAGVDVDEVHARIDVDDMVPHGVISDDVT